MGELFADYGMRMVKSVSSPFPDCQMVFVIDGSHRLRLSQLPVGLWRGVILFMLTSSILTKASLEPLLNQARQHLERDDFLVPVLLLNVGAIAPVLTSLTVPPSIEERRAYVSQIGIRFRNLNQTILEAAVLMEAWFVMAKETPAATRVMPSKHPCRQEAIVLIGRNADNTRATQVIQPFTRASDKRLLWSKLPVTSYDQPTGTGTKPVGLLDDLFLANQKK